MRISTRLSCQTIILFCLPAILFSIQLSSSCFSSPLNLCSSLHTPPFLPLLSSHGGPLYLGPPLSLLLPAQPGPLSMGGRQPYSLGAAGSCSSRGQACMVLPAGCVRSPAKPRMRDLCQCGIGTPNKILCKNIIQASGVRRGLVMPRAEVSLKCKQCVC